MHTKLLTILICLILCNLCWGQTVLNTPKQEQDTATEQQPQGVVFDTEEPDSVLQRRVFMFHVDPHMVKIHEITHPTLNPAGTQYHDRLDALNGDFFLSKGMVGQSHQSIYPNFAKDLTWEYQPDVNAGYAKTASNIYFYQTQTPFTSLGYQSSLKRAYQVNVAHTQNIMPRWNVAFDYHLINPEGIYTNSSVLNHYLDGTTNYYSKDSRYQMYTGVIWQKLKMGENGGILDDYLFEKRSQSNYSGIPVRFNRGGSIYNSLKLFTHNTYNLVRQVESVRERSMIQVSEKDSNLLDTLFYYDTLLPGSHSVFNPGVIGFDASYNRNSRKYIDSTNIHTITGVLFWSNDAFTNYRWENPIKLTVGIKPQYVLLKENDSIDHRFFTLSPFAKLSLAYRQSLLGAEIELATGDNYRNGDLRLAAHYRYTFDSLRHIEAIAIIEQQAPDYFFHHYSSNGYTWDYSNLKKALTQRFDINYQNGNFFDISVTAQHLRNHVWLEGDTSYLTTMQGNNAFWLLQGRMMLRFELWGWLHYDMQQMVQYSTDDHQLRVPLFASKNSLYTNIYIFKRALRAQFGIDIRYHTSFYADAYSPEVGAFFHQDDTKVGNNIWGDVYINLQIKRASIYVKAGHLNSVWETEAKYFTLPHNPGINFGLYYGFTWKFFD